ncbi:MAG: serine/threonine protein kinase, partial [Planctomycetota bacterium]
MDWEAFYRRFREPDFIAGYEIQNRLGGGAFGDVYKARKQSIGKAYAVKFLKLEDDTQRQVVERELSTVRHFAAIDHPNLVTIEDMGVAMGVPYLIMGYAGEATLARRLSKGPLGPEAALMVFDQVCRGVLALHDRRLVHFDLKPSNVFLKGDVARVGDYGLSKLLTDGRMTLSFGRGTPQYMAPEILRSRADHRADIYSLGVILYESLVGELPYKPERDSALVLRETDEAPVYPDGFPERLRPIVEGCLRLKPDDRYADVGVLLEDLAKVDESESNGAPTGPPPREPEPEEAQPLPEPAA